MASSFLSDTRSDNATSHPHSPHSNLILQSISLAKIAHSLQKEVERAKSDDFAERLAEQAEATLQISRNLLRLGALVVEQSNASQTHRQPADEVLPVLEVSPLDLGEPLVIDERYNITARDPRLVRRRLRTTKILLS